MTKEARYAGFFVGALTLLRLAAIAFQSLNLGPDEAQYWAWAQQPDLGYFSKPPLIAWLIALTTRIGGDSEFGVRMAAPLLHGATALLIFAIGQKLYGARVALGSALVFVTIPAVSLSSALITTDVPLLFFWAAALYVLVEALDRPSAARAILLGAVIGLGLLSKYAMGYFLLCAGIAAILVPGMRRIVVSPFGLLTVLSAGLVFAPNIYWNIEHSFATVAHTAANANLSNDLIHPSSLGGFLGTQFGVFGPILFVALLIISFHMVRNSAERREPDRLLACFVFPVLLAAALVAFLSRANANWAAPAYVAATPLVVQALLSDRRYSAFAASLALHSVIAIGLAAGVIYPALADHLGLANALKRVRGWDRLGAEIARRANEGQYTAILADDRELMGELIFYAAPRSIPVVMWDFERPALNQYELVNRITEKTGTHVIFAALTPDPVHVLRRFSSTEPLGPITVTLDAKRSRSLYLFDLEGFRPRGKP